MPQEREDVCVVGEEMSVCHVQFELLPGWCGGKDSGGDVVVKEEEMKVGMSIDAILELGFRFLVSRGRCGA